MRPWRRCARVVYLARRQSLRVDSIPGHHFHRHNLDDVSGMTIGLLGSGWSGIGRETPTQFADALEPGPEVFVLDSHRDRY